MGRVAVIVVVVVAVLGALRVAAPAVAEARPGAIVYQAPVPGPIVDPYRPPSTPYGPGNRGVDYATVPGATVAAPADGVVTFAGAVAGGLHVVVLHADGVRTSLSFLAGVLVARGQQVVRGQTVGRSGPLLHFGARRGEAYLDPTTLLAAGAGTGSRSVLVPDGPGRPLGADEEAAGLRHLVAGVTARAGLPAAGVRGGITGSSATGSTEGAGRGRPVDATGASRTSVAVTGCCRPPWG